MENDIDYSYTVKDFGSCLTSRLFTEKKNVGKTLLSIFESKPQLKFCIGLYCYNNTNFLTEGSKTFSK